MNFRDLTEISSPLQKILPIYQYFANITDLSEKNPTRLNQNE